jgi:hypothetical protein
MDDGPAFGKVPVQRGDVVFQKPIPSVDKHGRQGTFQKPIQRPVQKLIY